jgi:hypothetical protein
MATDTLTDTRVGHLIKVEVERCYDASNAIHPQRTDRPASGHPGNGMLEILGSIDGNWYGRIFDRGKESIPSSQSQRAPVSDSAPPPPGCECLMGAVTHVILYSCG